MASTVEICNRALQKLGAKRIVSLTEDSVNGRACNFAYEVIKKAELRKHVWNFSIGRAEIAADGTAPSWGRDNSYTLPSDFLRLADDYPEDANNAKDWQIEQGKILTDDSSPIYVRYVQDITDPNTMDSLFREVVSASLAVQLCEELTQSNTKKDSLKDDYDKLILLAKRTNAIENVAGSPPEDPWITVRE